MKKLILVAFIVLAMGTFAFAQMGKGRGFNAEVTVTTAAQAEELAKEKATTLKGYTVGKAEEVPVRRGTAYKVSAKDGMKNKMYFFVTPFGAVFGPITEASAKNIGINNCVNNNANCGYGCPQGMRGGKGFQQQGEPVVVTAEQAKNAAEKYIKGLKGYSIESVESFANRGGRYISYRVYLKDGSDNTFYVRVDPWGNIPGLMSYTRTK